MDIEKLIDDHQDFLFKGVKEKRLVISNFHGKIKLGTRRLSGATILNSKIALDASNTTLEGATFYKTTLYDADFSGANLSRVNFTDSDLFASNFENADLSFADLSGSDLRATNFTDSKLYKTKFRNNWVNSRTKFGNMENVDCPIKCPTERKFVGWKKCRDKVIVKLLIVGERSSSTSNKCRASSVEVLEVFGGDVGISIWDSRVKYRTGDFLIVPDYEKDRWKECAAGIHFFVTREEAENFHF